jgi:hypothetical protein
VRLLAFAPVVSLLATLALPAGAQQATPTAPPRKATALPVVPGARVRISATTMVVPLVANFLEMRGDTAVFIEASAGRGIWTFPLDQITKLEQSEGDKRYNSRPMVKSALIGAPIGAVAFWAVTGLYNPSDSTRRFNRGSTAGIGLVAGAIVGALVGSRFTAEHWMALPLPHRMTISPFRRGGPEVGLSFTF